MIEFNSGRLFMTDSNNVPYLIGKNLTGTAEVEMSANETAQMHFDMYKKAELSCDSCDINISILEKMCDYQRTNVYTVEWDIKAMVQARWHKKARINKKWLRRYGMKPDTVHVVGQAKMLSVDDKFNFDLDVANLQYVLRSDQKRRGLKIEW